MEFYNDFLVTICREAWVCYACGKISVNIISSLISAFLAGPITTAHRQK